MFPVIRSAVNNKAFLAGTAAVLVFVAGLFVLFLFLRNQKPAVPEAIDETVAIDLPSSTFNLPVRIGLGTLSGYLNAKISGRFLDKTFFLQESKKEKVAVSLTRKGSITVRAAGNELVCSVPLTVDASLVESRFGKKLAALLVKPVHAGLVITLSTPVSIDRSWNIVTRFRIMGYRWTKDPVVRIGPFSKNLRPDVNGLISSRSRELTTLLDREIYKAAGLRPTIEGVWLDLQEPIPVSRKPFPVWIRFLCTDISGSLSLDQQEIVCFTRLRATARVLTDTSNAEPSNPLPEFTALHENRKESLSDIHLHALTSFAEINDQLNALVRGKTIQTRGYHVTITGIRAYASTRGLSIAVSTDRDLKGHVVTSGKVVFDPRSQTLRVKDFDFALNTGNTLVGTGEALLHRYVRDSVAARLNVKLDTLIGKVPFIINNAVSGGKAGRVIDMKVDSLAIRNCLIRIDRDNMHFIINVSARAGLKLKRIKPGRAVRIRA